MKKKKLLIPSCAIILGISASLYYQGYLIKKWKTVGDSGYAMPLGDGGPLLISVTINEISRTLNDILRRDISEPRLIKLYDTNSSYKSSSFGWLVVSDDFITVNLPAEYMVLTKGELNAMILHEISHFKLNHEPVGSFIGQKDDERNIRKEIDADIYAVGLGADKNALYSAIRKLGFSGVEKSARLEVLGSL